MNRFCVILCALGMILPAAARPASPNIVTFADGRKLAVEVHRVEGEKLVCSRALEFGRAVERYPLDSIVSVTFPEQVPLAAAASLAPAADRIEKLRPLWNSLRPFVRVPGTPAGHAGLLLARALYEEGPPAALAEAMEILQTLERDDPSPETRAGALSLRLIVMGAQGRGPEAREEAARIFEQTGRPEPRVRAAAGYALANLLREDLAELERENPRWELDPLVRPDRNRLHHRIIELFLQPYLENGSQAGPAARSLWALVEFHRVNDREKEAASVARDIVEIYPETPEAPQAEAFLQTLKTKP
mgnify:CR=1 FL=1